MKNISQDGRLGGIFSKTISLKLSTSLWLIDWIGWIVHNVIRLIDWLIDCFESCCWLIASTRSTWQHQLPVLFSLIGFTVKDPLEVEFASNRYYALCGLGGILSCGLTHTAIVPLDLVKCRIQVTFSLFLPYQSFLNALQCLFQLWFLSFFSVNSLQVDPGKYKGVFSGFGVTIKEDGIRGLGRGWAPTFFGYSAQGMFKFGLYEIFKVEYHHLIGDVSSINQSTDGSICPINQ